METLDSIPQLDPMRLHALADQVCGRESDSLWPLFAHLLQNLLGRTARFAVSQQMEEIVAGEQEFMHKLLSVQSPERWMSLWMQASRWFSDTERLAFDRRQVLFSLLHAMEGKELELENVA